MLPPAHRRRRRNPTVCMTFGEDERASPSSSSWVKKRRSSRGGTGAARRPSGPASLGARRVKLRVGARACSVPSPSKCSLLSGKPALSLAYVHKYALLQHVLNTVVGRICGTEAFPLHSRVPVCTGTQLGASPAPFEAFAKLTIELQYGVPTPKSVAAKSVDEAAAAFQQFGKFLQ